MIHATSDIFIHDNEPLTLYARTYGDGDTPCISIQHEKRNVFNLFLHDCTADAADGLADEFDVLSAFLRGYANSRRREGLD